jgi:hypothetical protein
MIPVGPQPLPSLGANELASLGLQPQPTRMQRAPRVSFHTEPDIFGRYRVYSSQLLRIPDTDAPTTLTSPPSSADKSRSLRSIISPCPNMLVFYVQRHHWLGGATKSLEDHKDLCDNVFLQPDFNPCDVVGVNLEKLDKKLTKVAKTCNPVCPPSEGWRKIPLRLEIPPTTHSLHRGLPNAFIEIPAFYACNLTDVIRKQFISNDLSTFHYEPFESYWTPPGTNQHQQLFDEIYSSPTMMRAHCEVQAAQIADKNCTLP